MTHAPWAHNTICEIVLIGAHDSQTVVNVHAFEASALEEATFVSDAVADASAQALRDDWITNLLTAYRAIHGTLYSLTTVGSQIVERPATVSHRLGRQDRSNTPLPSAGTFSTATGMLPTEVAGVIKWRSLIASRHSRGRSYVGGMSRDMADVSAPNKLIAGAITAMTTYASTLSTRYAVGGGHDAWNLTVYSRPYDNPHGNYVKRVGGVLQVVNKPDYAGDSNFVTSFAIDPVLRTQRRREFGVGV